MYGRYLVTGIVDILSQVHMMYAHRIMWYSITDMVDILLPEVRVWSMS